MVSTRIPLEARSAPASTRSRSANSPPNSIFFPNDSQFRGEWCFWLHDQTESVLLTPRLMINNSDTMIDAILQGVGIALIPTFIANSYLLNGRLKRVCLLTILWRG
ncbi:LysR substrate-binding domain-containing protein [Pectobacterium parmentieri]|uniref:LysR substrate-binding domain-containing protein n=1 Tax=Pectobacterium parmentieri TaxID=1905730 RepID=UPI001E2B24D2|nr:LysR substrate-binding domain-containing protein [Pectobacterium parmentieri]